MHVRPALVSLALVPLGVLTGALTAGAAPPPPTGLTLVGQLDDLPSSNLSDMSFWGDRMVVGYGMTERRSGFALVDISDPGRPAKLSTTDCLGTTNDVTLYGELVLVSVDGTEHRGPRRCGGRDDSSAGLRIFSVADPAHPVEVRDIVETCNGSHNHTAVPDLDHVRPDGTVDPRLLVYLNNAACRPEDAAGLPHRAVEVVEVPIHHPQDAVVLPSDFPLGPAENGCHDVQVFGPTRLALAACSASGAQLWDVTRPEDPMVLASDLDALTPEQHRPHPGNVNMNHSGAFSLDGDVLVVGEESGGGLVNACNGQDDQRGMLRFYDVSDPARPLYRSSYKIQEPVASPYCTPHLFGVVNSLDGRRLFTVAWFGGGVRVLDATDPRRVREIASYESGSTAYAAYEYRGHVYVTNLPTAFAPLVGGGGGGRGLEVLRLDGIRTRHVPSLDPQMQQVGTGRAP